MISISLEGDRNKFRPGERIAGSFRWSDIAKLPITLEARLIWYTSGKGNRDVAVLDKATFGSNEASGQEHFEFVAPSHPYSFSGKLISLIWAVEVITFPDQEAQQLDLVIAPGGNEIILTPVSS